MKTNFLKLGLCVAMVGLLTSAADAQRTPRKRNTTPTTNPANTNDPAQQQQQNNNAPINYNPYAGIPIIRDSTGMGDTAIRKSLRNDNAFDKSSVTTRNPLPYENLRWDDALYAEKVWRELDLREKMNQTFRYDAKDDNGSQLFIDMLLKAVNNGQVTAFADDRFTTPLAISELSSQTAGGFDTIAVMDLKDLSKIDHYSVTQRVFDSKSVIKLRIKEEWVFDRESSRMFVRILGIAPIKTLYLPNGQERQGGAPMFWIYYPDLRPMLAKSEVYNPKNMGQSRMTWEELFESRMFSSYILKSTLDNAANKTIRQYIKDPILALLEGDNIKEKIFNFEQDLWSY